CRPCASEERNPPSTSLARCALADCAEMFAAYASSPAGRSVPSTRAQSMVARAGSASRWAMRGMPGLSSIFHAAMEHVRYTARTMLSTFLCGKGERDETYACPGGAAD